MQPEEKARIVSRLWEVMQGTRAHVDAILARHGASCRDDVRLPAAARETVERCEQWSSWAVEALDAAGHVMVEPAIATADIESDPAVAAARRQVAESVHRLTMATAAATTFAVRRRDRAAIGFEQAYMEGLAACDDAVDLDDCPYDAGTSEFANWRNGYEDEAQRVLESLAREMRYAMRDHAEKPKGGTP